MNELLQGDYYSSGSSSNYVTCQYTCITNFHYNTLFKLLAAYLKRHMRYLYTTDYVPLH